MYFGETLGIAFEEFMVITVHINIKCTSHYILSKWLLLIYREGKGVKLPPIPSWLGPGHSICNTGPAIAAILS